MKVEDAKEKICPFMSQMELPTEYKREPFFSTVKCITTNCMAWIPTKSHVNDANVSPIHGYCAKIGNF